MRRIGRPFDLCNVDPLGAEPCELAFVNSGTQQKRAGQLDATGRLLRTIARLKLPVQAEEHAVGLSLESRRGQVCRCVQLRSRASAPCRADIVLVLSDGCEERGLDSFDQHAVKAGAEQNFPGVHAAHVPLAAPSPHSAAVSQDTGDGTGCVAGEHPRAVACGFAGDACWVGQGEVRAGRCGLGALLLRLRASSNPRSIPPPWAGWPLT